MRPIDADALRDVFAGEPPAYYTTAYILGLIDRLPTVAKDTNVHSKWISVTDKLPQIPSDCPNVLRKWYLVALESGCVMDLSYDFTLEEWASTVSPVTHWMPLPEPPKEG